MRPICRHRADFTFRNCIVSNSWTMAMPNCVAVEFVQARTAWSLSHEWYWRLKQSVPAAHILFQSSVPMISGQSRKLLDGASEWYKSNGGQVMINKLSPGNRPSAGRFQLIVLCPDSNSVSIGHSPAVPREITDARRLANGVFYFLTKTVHFSKKMVNLQFMHYRCEIDDQIHLLLLHCNVIRNERKILLLA